MEKFKTSLITDAGRGMLLGLGSGNTQLTYTKAVLYDQDLSSMQDDQIRALTALTGEKLSTNISNVKVNKNTVLIYATFANGNLSDDITFNTVGWYAKSSYDNQEKLLAISPSIGTQTLAAGSPDHRSTAEIDINLAMGISNDVSVNVVVDQTGVVHNKDLQDAIEQVKIDLKADIEQAGKVKSVTMNSAKYEPDSTGNINLGDALLPSLTAITVGSDDVNIAYNSGKNKYTADITNALNKVINSSHLTDLQKQDITIHYADVTSADSGYTSKSKTVSNNSGSFSIDNAGTVQALNSLNNRVGQNENTIDDLKHRKADAEKLDVLTNQAVKSVNSITPVSGNVTLDTVDTLKVVTDLGDNKSLLSVLMDAYDDSIFQNITNAETIESKKSSDATLVTKELLDDLIKTIISGIADSSKNTSKDIADIKANYATKQWVTDNFMPKPYITNSSSTADTYSKAHPDQLVILTK